MEARSLTLLNAAPGLCQACAVDHPLEAPHNQQSLYWQLHFYQRHGRFPTWADALQHCTPEVQAAWAVELLKYGIEV